MRRRRFNQKSAQMAVPGAAGRPASRRPKSARFGFSRLQATSPERHSFRNKNPFSREDRQSPLLAAGHSPQIPRSPALLAQRSPSNNLRSEIDELLESVTLSMRKSSSHPV